MSDSRSEEPEPIPTLEFKLSAIGASKRPEQLAAMLDRVLGQEFAEVFQELSVSPDPEACLVRIVGLDKLDAQAARRVVQRARGAFNEFMTSPWY